MVLPTVFLASAGFAAKEWPKRNLKSLSSVIAGGSLPALSHVDAMPIPQLTLTILPLLRFWPGWVAICCFSKWLKWLASGCYYSRKYSCLASYVAFFFFLMVCSMRTERFSKWSGAANTITPKRASPMGNIFPLGCSLLLFKLLFSKDAKRIISLHLLPEYCPQV